MEQNVKPSIYVACLAAYNSGYLHGQWIDASQSADDIYSQIQTMLSQSPIGGAEEFAIHDYEGFGSIQIEEYDSIDTIVEYATFMGEYGDLGAELLSEYSVSEAVEMIEENYHGFHDSESDFAYQLIQDCYGNQALPDNLMNYFDYDAFARDLFMCDYFSIDSNHGVHVFTNI
jgi:antirestriction protein